MFYSASTGGFYDHAIHGDNIPADAVEITSEEHAALLAGQSAGKLIAPDENGIPTLREHQEPTANEVIRQQIIALESSVTDRRMREAVIGIDGGWLQSLNNQIAALREQMTN